MPVITPNPITVVPAKTSGGSVKNPANLIAYSAAAQGPQSELWANVVKSLRDLQSQVDGLANALRAPLPLPDPIQVVDTAGNLQVAIGQIINLSTNQSFIGLWANVLWIGGTAPTSSPTNGSIVIVNSTDSSEVQLLAQAGVGGRVQLSDTGGTVRVDLNVNTNNGQLALTKSNGTLGFYVLAGNGSQTTATTGANGAPPAQVAGYYTIRVDGTDQKFPYYNV